MLMGIGIIKTDRGRLGAGADGEEELTDLERSTAEPYRQQELDPTWMQQARGSKSSHRDVLVVH